MCQIVPNFFLEAKDHNLGQAIQSSIDQTSNMAEIRELDASGKACPYRTKPIYMRYRFRQALCQLWEY